MFWFTLVGLILLVVWVIWVLYIVNPQGQVTVSLLLKVRQSESWLDPFLRAACYLFAQASHLRLLEIWVLATDAGEAARPIAQRLAKTHPVIFQGQVADMDAYLCEAQGQVLWVFDMIEQNTPVTALRALEQLLLQAGPMSTGPIVLEKSPT